MAAYTVLMFSGGDEPSEDHGSYDVVGAYEARSPSHARRLAAERMSVEVVDRGVLLVAVTSKAWSSGHGREQAETTRRIRSDVTDAEVSRFNNVVSRVGETYCVHMEANYVTGIGRDGQLDVTVHMTEDQARDLCVGLKDALHEASRVVP